VQSFEKVSTPRIVRSRCRPNRARCWIVWEWGQVPLTDGEHLIGRDDDVTVWLESPSVSRHHARIRISGTEAAIEDLGSKNGTYIRGERLATLSMLTDGDEIRLGSVVLKFRSADASGVTETQHVG
jgi:pSer/pThr/pTyr-binding forkhead associated (FHA) protein